MLPCKYFNYHNQNIWQWHDHLSIVIRQLIFGIRSISVWKYSAKRDFLDDDEDDDCGYDAEDASIFDAAASDQEAEKLAAEAD